MCFYFRHAAGELATSAFLIYNVLVLSIYITVLVPLGCRALSRTRALLVIGCSSNWKGCFAVRFRKPPLHQMFQSKFSIFIPRSYGLWMFHDPIAIILGGLPPLPTMKTEPPRLLFFYTFPPSRHAASKLRTWRRRHANTNLVIQVGLAAIGAWIWGGLEVLGNGVRSFNMYI